MKLLFAIIIVSLCTLLLTYSFIRDDIKAEQLRVIQQGRIMHSLDSLSHQ